MYQTLLIQPLITSLVPNRKTGIQIGPQQSTMNMILTALLAIIIWIEVGYGGCGISQTQGNWMVTSSQLNIEWAQTYDSQTSAMQIPVLFVSAQVQLYSCGYMSSDPHKTRFFSYQSIFTFFMQIQITGDNLLVMFVG